MNRFPALLLSLLMFVPLARAEKRKVQAIDIQTDIQPDALPLSLQPAQALPHSQDLIFHRKPQRRQHFTGKRGIDVSHYQNRINWEAVARNEDVNYVYIKATEHAGMVDHMFQANLRGARRVGIPVGCYHFFSPTAAPTAQLQNMTSAVPHLGEHDLIPMIDVEVKGRKTTPEELRHRLKVFLKGVENYYGVKPLIYTGQNFYNKYLAGYFEDYLFMIAKYSEGTPELDGNPKFAMWQFSASGRVEGIEGSVDCSCFMDNYNIQDILIKRK
ncbi:MAG: glycosyl hydrolase family 25 [Bacteroidaceae bacterium]|nr:glycosyl hydrolase family 25 [Bacteroidaceae bacterium]